MAMNKEMITIIVSLVFAACWLQNASAQPALTDRLLYNCTFETGLCNMTLEPDPSGFTWTRFQGSTPSDPTGPDYDHTTLTAEGWYMYTEATDFQPGDIAKLVLPPITPTPPPQGPVCLTFWYNMFGQHIGTLNVTQDNTDVLWSLSFNQSYGWFQANVTVSNLTGGALRFVGVRGGQDIGQPFGDIAIDDVFIYDGSSGPEETSTVTTSTIPTTTLVLTTTVPTTSLLTTTAVPTTAVPTTAVPTTAVPTTAVPTTAVPTTAVPTTAVPTTAVPTTAVLTTAVLTTIGIATSVPSTTVPTSNAQTTAPVAAPSATIIQAYTTPVASMVPSTTAQYNVTSGITSQNFSPDNMEVKVNSLSTSDPTTVTFTQTGGERDTTSALNTVTQTTYMSGNSSTNSSMPSKEAQAGYSPQQGTIWNLTQSNLILILALLSAAILLLILTVVVLACCLCVTKRKYNVERSANMYGSDNSTMDGVSTVEGHRAKDNASFDRISVEY